MELRLNEIRRFYENEKKKAYIGTQLKYPKSTHSIKGLENIKFLSVDDNKNNLTISSEFIHKKSSHVTKIELTFIKNKKLKIGKQEYNKPTIDILLSFLDNSSKDMAEFIYRFASPYISVKFDVYNGENIIYEELNPWKTNEINIPQTTQSGIVISSVPHKDEVYKVINCLLRGKKSSKLWFHTEIYVDNEQYEIQKIQTDRKFVFANGQQYDKGSISIKCENSVVNGIPNISNVGIDGKISSIDDEISSQMNICDKIKYYISSLFKNNKKKLLKGSIALFSVLMLKFLINRYPTSLIC